MSGYRGNKLISAKTVDGEQAAYLAELFLKDGLRKITVHEHAAADDRAENVSS